MVLFCYSYTYTSHSPLTFKVLESSFSLLSVCFHLSVYQLTLGALAGSELFSSQITSYSVENT